MDVFTVSWHNLIISSQSALASWLSPIWVFIGSMIESVITFIPIIIWICVMFFVLNFVFNRATNWVLDKISKK